MWVGNESQTEEKTEDKDIEDRKKGKIPNGVLLSSSQNNNNHRVTSFASRHC